MYVFLCVTLQTDTQRQDGTLLSTFYPMLAIHIFEDQVREEDEAPSPLDSDFLHFFRNNVLARKVIEHLLCLHATH
jgi:hypothetical protein